MRAKDSLLVNRNLCIFSLIGIILLFGTSLNAGEPEIGTSGDTGYILVQGFDMDSITTEKGTFQIDGQTRIYDDMGREIDIIVIPIPSMASIQYVSVNRMPLAREIWVRELYPEERDELRREEMPRDY